MRRVPPTVWRLVPTCVAVCLIVTAAPAGQVLPCGVADPGGRTGFVTNPQGGIDAVDLATGDLLWDLSDAQRPVLAEDDRLFAWTAVKPNGLRVLAFDRTRHGRQVLESDPVSFPDWVNVGEEPGRSFTTHWRLEKGRLILDWEARAWYSGAHATPQLEAEAQKSAEGQVRIDVETGKVETAAAEAPARSPQPPKELEKAVVRWQGAAGGGRAALVQEEDERGQRLTLWFWGADKINPPKELFAGKRLLVLPTLDDRSLCLRDAAPSPDQGPGPAERKKYDWSIFNVADGERLAEVPYEPGTEEVAVVGARAFCLVAGPLKGSLDKPFVRPRGLKAFDLKTGKPLWEHPVEGKLCSPPGP